MRMFRSLLAGSLLMWLMGCNNSATSPSLPPQPVTHVVSGILSKTADGVSHPLAGRTVSLWIAESNRGWRQSATTDQSGRYTAIVPTARVFVSAWEPPDEQQPCLASAAVDADTTANVEVLPVGTSATPLSASPLITAFVYETTPQGRIPLRDVHVSVEVSSDVWVAYTRTDDMGRFYLCRVTTPVRMVVSAGNGFQDVWQSLPGTGDMALEIELKR